ncbi:flagellar biosynthetic protein FliO [Virgibacillus indicus]|uniref:flagellar biosynthetic protein FliO n=1 Tax=Virgibacillus indicus TaxID=2024554 RepID=UPI001F0ADF45|nr:flagellar biosynthetic protein FliO [Virgibacillus indicus]
MAKHRIVSILIIAFLITAGSVIQVNAATVDEWLKESDNKKEEKMDEPESGDAEAEQDESDAVIEDNGSLLFDLIKMFFALLLVLALIYLLLKFLNKRNKLLQKIKALENLGGISVGQNKSIQIVRIGKQFYLVGVGENVEMLQEITDEEVINDLLEHGQESENDSSTLLSVPFFQSKTDKNNSSQNDFKNLFSSELEKLKQNRNKIINNKKKKEDEHE